jgi:hypothetical protein
MRALFHRCVIMINQLRGRLGAMCFLAPALLLFAAACTPVPAGPAPRGSALQRLYDASIAEAAVYRASHVRALKPAVADGAGNVRVLTYTSWPGYTAGRDSLTREVWVTLVPEVRDSCAGFGAELPLRLNQLLGLPPTGADTLMVEMTVPLAALFRPAADPAATTRYPCGDTLQADCGERFPPSVSAAHVQWLADSFLLRWRVPGGYPWSRLGYTWNWHPGSPPYGASEYVLRAGTVASEVVVNQLRDYCAPARQAGPEGIR